MATIPPNGDQQALVWTTNFSEKLTANPTNFGATSAQATALASALSDYQVRLVAATQPDTRNKVSVADKNEAKAILMTQIRSLLKIISAFPGLNSVKRAELGMNPKDSEPTPIPAPSTRPLLEVRPDGSLDVLDELLTPRRRKPDGAVGAIVYMKLAEPGSEPPATPDDAKFAMVATRASVRLPLPADADAKKLFVLAQWFNERGELGPVSAVASTTIAA